jgi:hypothetical protein
VRAGSPTSVTELTVLLDRQYDYLRGQVGIDYARQLVRFLDVLLSEPRLGALLTDMMIEGASALAEHVHAEQELIPRIAAVRREIEERVGVVPPSVYGLVAGDEGLTSGVAVLDELLSRQPPSSGAALAAAIESQPTPTTRLTRLLQGAVRALANGRAADPGLLTAHREGQGLYLRDIADTLRDLDIEARYLEGSFDLGVHVDPRIALLRVTAFAYHFIPHHDGVPLRTGWSGWQIVAELGDGRLLAASNARMRRLLVEAESETDHRRSELPLLVTRVYEELRLRIGLRRSLVSTLERFKQRCEQYDRAELVGLREPELTLRLAKYLFDMGLSPLVNPEISGLKPDIYDERSHLYVEAKKYASDYRRGLVAGLDQMTSTIRRFPDPEQIWDAFFVVFRLGGPLYQLPRYIGIGGLPVHLIVIDVAPSKEAGSRFRGPVVEISADELESAISR